MGIESGAKRKGKGKKGKKTRIKTRRDICFFSFPSFVVRVYRISGKLTERDLSFNFHHSGRHSSLRQPRSDACNIHNNHLFALASFFPSTNPPKPRTFENSNPPRH